MEFAGRASQIFLSKAKAAIKNRAVGVAKYGQRKSIPQFTSVNADFRSATLDNLSLGLRNLNGTVLFVVKKNKRILENLIAWLKNSVDFGKNTINHSLLLLDDEADNASVNTRDDNENPTAINNCIRTILKLFKQTTYIGVTATPFMNIFINPFDEQGMLNDDLYDAKNSFNYEQNPDGLRVIAIGGNSFSRGLTLEGLCVTYFYRNSKTYDMLMQM